MMKLMCPRFETNAESLLWLRENVKEYSDVYDVMYRIETAEIVNGIPTFGEELVNKLDKINVLPIWFGNEVYELDVEPKQLYWKVPQENEIMEELGIELDNIYAASSVMTQAISLNVSSTYLFSSIDEKQYETTLRIYLHKLKKLQASILKQAAEIATTNIMMNSIRGRHITLQESFRNILVPRHLLKDLLKKDNIIKHMIVVDDTIAYVYIHNKENVVEILEKLGVEITRIVPLAFHAMKQVVDYDENTDTLIGHVVRHPIIGYVAVGSMKTANINGVGVPADISEKLDGDDDGDNIDTFPSVLLKNVKKEFVTTILDL